MSGCGVRRSVCGGKEGSTSNSRGFICGVLWFCVVAVRGVFGFYGRVPLLVWLLDCSGGAMELKSSVVN
jgi:hypothetical protein